MVQRHIPLDGTPNFRDLGGYQAANGRHVQYGRLFRSGVLSQLSEQDLQTLEGIRLGVICDFRRDEETERDPTRLPPSGRTRIAHMPIDPGSKNSFFEQLAEGEDRGATDADMAQFMVDINRAFVLDHQATYAKLIAEMRVLPNDESLLFHCAAGKDRTGFGAALILMMLGASNDTIIEDYMLTAEYFDPDREINRLIKKYTDFGFGELDPQMIRPMLEVRPEYIQEALNTVESEYGGSENFLLKAFGLQQEDLIAFQDQFLS